MASDPNQGGKPAGRSDEIDNFFVGIGAQKAATSWLADYLDSHPGVCFSPIKELHYFDAEYLPNISGGYHKEMADRLAKMASTAPLEPTPEFMLGLKLMAIRVSMTKDPQQYRRYFEKLRQPGNIAVGEITPSYSMLDAAGFAAIRKIMPHAKFIFILRNPLTRYLSQVRFRESQRPETGFSAREQVLRHLYDKQYVLRGDYQRTLEALESVVPQADICVVFYEHLMSVEHADRELRKITGFLGLPHRPGDIGKKVNVGLSVDFGEEVQRKIVRRYARIYEFVFDRYGAEVPDSWRESYSLLGGERGVIDRVYDDQFKPWLVRFLTRQLGRLGLSGGR